MPRVEMYTTAICPYCIRAKQLLDHKGVPYTEIRIEHDRQRMQQMMERSNRHTVPQIFIDDHHVGGFDDLAKLDSFGKLDEILGLQADNRYDYGDPDF